MISVNGITIEQDAIGREMQHHPAEDRDDAERRAATALVVRELLVQRARQREIAGASEDERIAHLIEQEVSIPEPTDEEIARYYRRNTLRFMTSPLYEAAHILFPAHQGDESARSEAKAKAKAVIAHLEQNPRRLSALFGRVERTRPPPMLPFEAKAQRCWSTMQTNTHDHSAGARLSSRKICGLCA